MSGIAIVEEFLSGWAPDRQSLEAAFRRWLAPDAIWENVGLTRTASVEEAVALIDNFLPGLDHIVVDILAIAEKADLVLTERVDHLRTSRGDNLVSISVMGIFRINDGKIVEWRDYFDTQPFSAGFGSS